MLGPKPSLTRKTVHYAGRVQGVGFRYTTVRVAGRHAVSGFVQNLPDGRVKVVAEGERAAVDAFIEDVGRTLSRYIQDRTVQGAEGTGEFGTPRPGALEVRY